MYMYMKMITVKCTRGLLTTNLQCANDFSTITNTDIAAINWVEYITMGLNNSVIHTCCDMKIHKTHAHTCWRQHVQTKATGDGYIVTKKKNGKTKTKVWSMIHVWSWYCWSFVCSGNGFERDPFRHFLVLVGPRERTRWRPKESIKFCHKAKTSKRSKWKL